MVLSVGNIEDANLMLPGKPQIFFYHEKHERHEKFAGVGRSIKEYSMGGIGCNPILPQATGGRSECDL